MDIEYLMSQSPPIETSSPKQLKKARNATEAARLTSGFVSRYKKLSVRSMDDHPRDPDRMKLRLSVKLPSTMPCEGAFPMSEDEHS